ncbi:hypothetical protein ACVIVD_006385, partial [Bradyrhizobium liaoningense]
KPAPGHKIYPYLLRGLKIERPDHAWAMDITYIPMRRGFPVGRSKSPGYGHLKLPHLMIAVSAAEQQ